MVTKNRRNYYVCKMDSIPPQNEPEIEVHELKDEHMANLNDIIKLAQSKNCYIEDDTTIYEYDYRCLLNKRCK